MRRVYPRAYGGTAMSPDTSSSRTGLSPRVRGNRLMTENDGSLMGSIPARTGEPSRRYWASTAAWVYPRAYGGTPPHSLRPVEMCGLSPRVRGNHHSSGAYRAHVRSIPARTGEPRPGPPFGFPAGVYPRAYGGTRLRRIAGYGLGGLSPRVRGNQGETVSTRWLVGSIPARTGEPAPAWESSRCFGVYPRAYGGTLAIMAGAALVAGLSPRVRGNPITHLLEHARLWSIPARTGEP